MLGVNPYISFRGNCREAVEFYRSALGAEVLFSQTWGDSPMAGMAPGDMIMHCSIRVGGSVLMMCDNPREGAASGGNISLALGLNDPEQAKKLYDALAEGGTITMPLAKTFWAEAFGMVTDRFGIAWMVNCDAPPAAS
ncbi:MAG: VOC family protein [Acidobacteria bacterium]|nr:VOC family protein [Acidobacteriota bacterium]